MYTYITQVLNSALNWHWKEGGGGGGVYLETPSSRGFFVAENVQAKFKTKPAYATGKIYLFPPCKRKKA